MSDHPGTHVNDVSALKPGKTRDTLSHMKNGHKKPRSRRRKYSDSDKAMDLATLDANAGDISKTSRVLNLPASTLTDWSKHRGTNWEIAELREVKKLELAEKLEKVAHALTDNILARAESDFSVLVSLKDFAVTLGIAIDKMQLLKGQPTSRTEDVSKPRTNEERADRILKLVQPGKTQAA